MELNSPFAPLFIAIQAHIKTHVPEIRWIDQDYGQIDVYDGARAPVSFPAVLIDMDDAGFEDLSEGAQSCQLAVSIRLAFGTYSGSNGNVPRGVRHKALDYYNLEWLLNKALHGWVPNMSDTGDYSPEDYSPEDYAVMEACPYEYGHLTRTSSKTERRQDNIRVREIRYSIGFEDYSTLLQQTMSQAALAITP